MLCSERMCFSYFLLHVPQALNCSFTVDINLVKAYLKFTCNLPNNKSFTNYFSDTRKTHLLQLFSLFLVGFYFLSPFTWRNVSVFTVVTLCGAYIRNWGHFHYYFCHTSLTLRSRILLEKLMVFHQFFVTIKFITINTSASFWSLSLVKRTQPPSAKPTIYYKF